MIIDDQSLIIGVRSLIIDDQSLVKRGQPLIIGDRSLVIGDQSFIKGDRLLMKGRSKPFAFGQGSLNENRRVNYPPYGAKLAMVPTSLAAGVDTTTLGVIGLIIVIAIAAWQETKKKKEETRETERNTLSVYLQTYWRSLRIGMSEEDARIAVKVQPDRVQANALNGETVCSYHGGGELRFINGKLVAWIEPKAWH